MKTYFLKIILVLVIVVNINPVKAQYQSLFGSSQTSWNIIKGNFWGTGTDSLTIGLDTIINSINYKKVLYYDLTGGSPQLQNITGYLREDSTLGKAWYFSNIDTTEQLIMDLNLNLGDTFYVAGVWNSYVGYHPVDSIWFQSGRKHIRIDNEINPNIGGSNNEKVTFIEGIGTNIGISYQDLNNVNNFPYLLCSYKDINAIYQNSHPFFMGSCKYLSVGIDDNLTSEKPINIYPNPTKNILNIVVPDAQALKIDVYSIDGKLIERKSITKNIIIDVSKYQSGLYFINATNSKGEVFRNKFVNE